MAAGEVSFLVPIWTAQCACNNNSLPDTKVGHCQLQTVPPILSAADHTWYLHLQALAEQKVQLESAMSHYPVEVQQASLSVLAWQAHIATLYASPR